MVSCSETKADMSVETAATAAAATAAAATAAAATAAAATAAAAAVACFGHLSLKKEKKPLPASPLVLTDLLLCSAPAVSVSCCCFSLLFCSSLCSTCWLITSRMSSCESTKGQLAAETAAG